MDKKADNLMSKSPKSEDFTLEYPIFVPSPRIQACEITTLRSDGPVGTASRKGAKSNSRPDHEGNVRYV